MRDHATCPEWSPQPLASPLSPLHSLAPRRTRPNTKHQTHSAFTVQLLYAFENTVLYGNTARILGGSGIRENSLFRRHTEFSRIPLRCRLRPTMRRLNSLIVGLLLVQGWAVPLPAAEPTQADVAVQFREKVQPFLKTYCVSCHSGAKPKSDLDLGAFNTLEAVTKDHARWALVLDRLKAADMPPEEAKVQPAAEARKEIVAWIESVR